MTDHTQVPPIQTLDEILKGKVYDVPEGVEVFDAKFGYGLRVTRAFEAGEIIYSTNSFAVRPITEDFEMSLRQNGEVKVFRANKENMTSFRDMEIFAPFDCFMNHSCDPNTTSETSVHGYFSHAQVALRRIEAGEELTCNYLCFEFSSNFGGFQCSCGAKNCYGNIKGYVHISNESKESLKDKIDVEIKRRITA